MRYEWQTTAPKNLDLLAQKIADFFKQKKFVTTIKTSAEIIKISATPNNTDFKEKIDIEIQKIEKGIAVNFDLIEEKQKRIRAGMLLSLIMGGTFLLKDIRSKEKLDTLQEELLSYIQKTLSNSYS